MSVSVPTVREPAAWFLSLPFSNRAQFVRHGWVRSMGNASLLKGHAMRKSSGLRYKYISRPAGGNKEIKYLIHCSLLRKIICRDTVNSRKRHIRESKVARLPLTHYDIIEEDPEETSLK